MTRAISGKEGKAVAKNENSGDRLINSDPHMTAPEVSQGVALLPCPCCGSEAFSHAIEPHTHGPLASHMPDHPGSGYVECTGCNLAMEGTSEPEAIAAWNRRATPRTPAETREAQSDAAMDAMVAMTEDLHLYDWPVKPAVSTPAATGEAEQLSEWIKIGIEDGLSPEQIASNIRFAALAALDAIEAMGCAVVPVEPTFDMVNNWHTQTVTARTHRRLIYKRMLAARPGAQP